MFSQVLQQHRERKAALLAEIGTLHHTHLHLSIDFFDLKLKQLKCQFWYVHISNFVSDVKEREAQAAMEAHASFALDRLNAGMATVYHNQQRIETEAGKLQQQSARFQATTQRWLRMYNEFNDSLKVCILYDFLLHLCMII
jgi:hypothetical protein